MREVWLEIAEASEYYYSYIKKFLPRILASKVARLLLYLLVGFGLGWVYSELTKYIGLMTQTPLQ